jgi:hypothetical protein
LLPTSSAGSSFPFSNHLSPLNLNSQGANHTASSTPTITSKAVVVVFVLFLDAVSNSPNTKLWLRRSPYQGYVWLDGF